MPDDDSNSAGSAPMRRRFRLRFSLRSLLLFMLLVSAALALWGSWFRPRWQIEHILLGHWAHLNLAVFSPDGRRIVSASGDRTALVWDVETGRELIALIGHTSRISSVAFSPDGQRIVTASLDRTARVWRRVRPEWWYGVFWLPQFWAVALLAPVFLWSLRRDYIMLMRTQ